MKVLKEQIEKGELRGPYLLYGEERYLVNLYTEKIRRALLSEEDELMNLSVLESPKNLSDVLATLDTLPFMAEKRLLILKNSGYFQPGDDYSELASALEESELSVVVFAEEKVDKRSKLYKTVSSLGRAVEFKTQPEEVLTRWLAQEARKAGKSLSPSAAAYLVHFSGSDMTNLTKQLQKICAYLGAREEIRREDIAAIATPDIDDNIFAITDAIANKKAASAMKVYSDLISNGEAPQRVLYMIVRQFRQLLRSCILSKEGKSLTEIASVLGLRDSVTSIIVRQSRQFGEENLRQVLEELLEMDASSKNGNMEANDACMLIILKYAS